MTITVTGVNEAPSAPALANPQTRQGEAFTYTFDPSVDPEGHPVTYTATLQDGSALPGWLMFDGAARTFTITTSDPSVSGGYNVTATAGDGQSPLLTSQATFRLTVLAAGAPGFDTASAFRVPEKTAAVGTVTASDPDAGDTITSLVITGGVDRDRFSFSGDAPVWRRPVPSWCSGCRQTTRTRRIKKARPRPTRRATTSTSWN